MQQPRIDSAFSPSRGATSLLGRRPVVDDEAEPEATTAEEPAPAMDRRYRSHLQPPRPNMDWPDWAVRTQRVQERLASTLEQLIWGGIGALTGTAIAAVPAVTGMVGGSYPYVLWQPLGAAVGAVAAIAGLAIVRSGRTAERERLTPPSPWTTRPDRMG